MRSEFITTEFSTRRFPVSPRSSPRGAGRRWDPAQPRFRLPETLAILAVLGLIGYFGVSYAFTSLNASMDTTGYASQEPIAAILDRPANDQAVASR